jgi:hypothetical protein
VQPEHTPQQSEQSREQDRDRGQDVQIHRDWRAQEHGDERSDRATGRDDRYGHYDREGRTVGRNWRMEHESDRDHDGYRRDEYRDRDFDEGRGRRRIKICMEYENGDEYCHYRY